jgi:hypothetical protein
MSRSGCVVVFSGLGAVSLSCKEGHLVADQTCFGALRGVIHRSYQRFECRRKDSVCAWLESLESIFLLSVSVLVMCVSCVERVNKVLYLGSSVRLVSSCSSQRGLPDPVQATTTLCVWARLQRSSMRTRKRLQSHAACNSGPIYIGE